MKNYKKIIHSEIMKAIKENKKKINLNLIKPEII